MNGCSAVSSVETHDRCTGKKAPHFNAWLRCVKLGVPAYGLSNPEHPPAEEVQKLQCQYQRLIVTASPYVDMLEQLAKEWPAYVVVLTNNDGRILDLRVDPKATTGQLPIDLQPGASVAEEVVGNNGPGTALHSGQASVFKGPEHYNQSYLNWSTAGVPVNTPSGERIGALGFFLAQSDLAVESTVRVLEATAVTLGRAYSTAPDAPVAPLTGIKNAVSGEPENSPGDEGFCQYDLLDLALKIMGGFAHEVRNPLAIIRGFAQLLLEGTRPDHMRRYLSLILDEVDRVNDQIKGFISLSSSEESNDLPVDIESLLNDVNLLMDGYIFLKGVSLVIKIEPGIGSVKGNPQQLRQVLLNLIKNALDATPTGGTVTVQATKEAEGVRIEVADNGPGIPEEVMPRIFELFFTTRDGVGLGLAISRDIIRRHSGTITVHSIVNQGTRVTVTIPCSSPEG